jgi:hypothetical protein
MEIKMNSPKKTALNNMASTLTKGKAPKGKAPAGIPEAQLVELGASGANAMLGFISASEALNNVVAEARKIKLELIDLRQAKSKPLEAKQTAIFKNSFIDTIVASGKSKATAQSYFEDIAKAIKTGKAITTTNPHAKGGKGNTQKSKGGKGSDDNAKMTGALLNVWKLSDVASEALTTIEASIDNGMTLIEAIEDYLKLQGEDLTTGEAQA